MNELKFNSQICTTKEQSQRLLELGLKPETADCFHWNCSGTNYIGNIDGEHLSEEDVPAWSLHRLIEILDSPSIELSCNPYEEIIYNISERVKYGYLSQEYLME